MSMRWKSALVTCMCAFLLGACAVWRPVEGPLKTDTYVLNAPDGWMRFDTGAYVMISRDGPYLQYILVQERPLRQPFRYTRKTFTPNMLPLEAAAIILDDLQADPAVAGFQLVTNEPAMVDGREGFKLVFRYRNRSGLQLKTVYYGFLHETFYYSLRYTSAERHYFQKDLAAFEQVRETFRLVAN